VNLKTSHGTQFIIAHPVYNFLVLNSAKFQATVTLDKVKKISNPTVGGSCCILFLKNFRIECRIMALILRRAETTRDRAISVKKVIDVTEWEKQHMNPKIRNSSTKVEEGNNKETRTSK